MCLFSLKCFKNNGSSVRFQVLKVVNIKLTVFYNTSSRSFRNLYFMLMVYRIAGQWVKSLNPHVMFCVKPVSLVHFFATYADNAYTHRLVDWSTFFKAALEILVNSFSRQVQNLISGMFMCAHFKPMSVETSANHIVLLMILSFERACNVFSNHWKHSKKKTKKIIFTVKRMSLEFSFMCESSSPDSGLLRKSFIVRKRADFSFDARSTKPLFFVRMTQFFQCRDNFVAVPWEW
jgi:hypothetical protein